MKRVASIPGPTASAVSLIDLKEHLRVYHNDEDVLLGSIGLAATEYAERWTQRALSPRNATLRLSALPAGACPLDVPGGVVNTLTSLTVDGVAVAGLTVVGDSPAMVVPAADWPVPTGEGFPVVVTYNVGYQMVPEPLKRAIALLAAELFEQRRDGSDKTISTVPVSAEYMMRPYRIRPI